MIDHWLAIQGRLWLYQAGLGRNSGGATNTWRDRDAHRLVSSLLRPENTGSMVAGMELRCSADSRSSVMPAKMMMFDSDLQPRLGNDN